MANEIAAGFKGLESLAHGGTKMGEYSAHAAEHLPKTAVGEKLGTLPAGSTLNGASLDTIAAIDGNAAKIKDARGLAIDKDGNVSTVKTFGQAWKSAEGSDKFSALGYGTTAMMQSVGKLVVENPKIALALGLGTVGVAGFAGSEVEKHPITHNNHPQYMQQYPGAY